MSPPGLEVIISPAGLLKWRNRKRLKKSAARSPEAVKSIRGSGCSMARASAYLLRADSMELPVVIPVLAFDWLIMGYDVVT